MRLQAGCARILETINRNSGRVIAAVSLIYVVLVVVFASLKLLWFDEFITFYIAKLNGIQAIWGALARGTDPNPPLTHVLVMWCMRWFGDSAISVRLPAMIAGWIGLASLYGFLRRRVPPAFALIGVAFALTTFAFNYSYESRAYALMLAFAMLSLWLWRAALESEHKLMAAAGMALALAAGISSNYYAVLAFFPIAAGELARDLERRRIELRVWVALAAGAVPLAFYLPLIRAGVARFAPYAWNRPRPDVITDSYVVIVEQILWPALALLAAAAAQYVYQRWQRTFVPVLPRHEFVAIIVLMAYPFIAYAIAVARAGMISPRFVLPFCYGFAIAVAIASYRLFSGQAVAVVAVLGLCVSWMVARDIFNAHDLVMQRRAFYRVRDTLPPGATIVVSDSLLVLPLYHYSPPRLASRLVFPVDFEAIRRYKKEDSPEENLWAGRGTVFPVPMVPAAPLENGSADYVILSSQSNWLLQKFRADGLPTRQLPVYSHSKDITGAFPLSHAETFVYEPANTNRQLASQSVAQGGDKSR